MSDRRSLDAEAVDLLLQVLELKEPLLSGAAAGLSPRPAAVLMAANLAIFFGWTYPANVATENWTRPVPEWEALRAQWEYSHAVNAMLTFGALCLVVLSTLAAATPHTASERPAPP